MKNITIIILAIIVFLLLAGLVIGGIFYWRQNSEQCPTCSECPICSECPPCAECPEAEECTSEPIVLFTPSGLFTENEKEELQTKLINPFLDYNEDSGYPVLTMDIQKYDDEGWQYTVNAIMETGVTASFLFGEEGKDLDYYFPGCMGPCEFSDEFKEKYPEIVAQDEAANGL